MKTGSLGQQSERRPRTLGSVGGRRGLPSITQDSGVGAGGPQSKPGGPVTLDGETEVQRGEEFAGNRPASSCWSDALLLTPSPGLRAGLGTWER